MKRKNPSPIPEYIISYLSEPHPEEERTINAIARGVCLKLKKDPLLLKDRNGVVGRVYYYLHKMEVSKTITFKEIDNAMVWSLISKD